MKPARTLLFAGILLGSALLACTPSLPVDPAQGSPVPPTPTNAVSAHNPTRTPEPQATRTPLPLPTRTEVVESTTVAESPASEQLPMAVYFLAADGASGDQVWRAAPDGTTLDPITAQEGGIRDYDVSAAGHRLAYVTGNTLAVQELADGSTRVLVNGEPNDGSDAWTFTHQIEAPRWSPDGRTLAYGLNGLNVIDLDSGENRVVLANRVVDREGIPFPEILYRPDRWSPDGTAILLDVGFYEGADKAIYNLEEGRTIEFMRSGQTTLCCSSTWAADGSYVLLAGFAYGGLSSELWRMDASTGEGTLLVPAEAGDGTFQYTDWPHALDGRLHYFYANLLEAPSTTPPLAMVQSGVDGITGRVRLRSETTVLLDVLWAADGGLIVGVQPPPGDPAWPPHGPLVVIYSNDRAAWPLAADGRQPRWGP